MVKKYTKSLEARDINPMTEEVWTIEDVPVLWRKKVEKQIDADGYVIIEDGTVMPKEEV